MVVAAVVWSFHRNTNEAIQIELSLEGCEASLRRQQKGVRYNLSDLTMIVKSHWISLHFDTPVERKVALLSRQKGPYHERGMLFHEVARSRCDYNFLLQTATKLYGAGSGNALGLRRNCRFPLYRRSVLWSSQYRNLLASLCHFLESKRLSRRFFDHSDKAPTMRGCAC